MAEGAASKTDITGTWGEPLFSPLPPPRLHDCVKIRSAAVKTTLKMQFEYIFNMGSSKGRVNPLEILAATDTRDPCHFIMLAGSCQPC
jgi:hypothetical protein